MELHNETPFAARLLRAERPDGRFDATLVVKATFEYHRAAGWRAAAEQVPIVEEVLETPFGVFHTDSFVSKEGVDVCILGTIRPAQPATVAQLRLIVGGRSSELTVFGERQWIRSGGRLIPSQPVPFDSMPLGYSRAYGGVTEHDCETHIWPDNPIGRGYYLSPEGAEGRPLPNIESGSGPEQVRTWEDQPQVAGWGPYPLFWALRAREGIEPPQEPLIGEMAKIKPRLNNHAHPSLILERMPDDPEIRIQGMWPKELVCHLPEFVPLAHVHVGERMTEARGSVDGIFLWTDHARVTLTSRIHFEYEYNKGEPRRTRLFDSAKRATS